MAISPINALLKSKICKPDKEDSKLGGQKGYTLIEVLITIVIMGMILLVVNVVLVTLIRVSYDTDARIQIREEMEFSLEVIQRNAKSAMSGSVESPGGDSLSFDLSETGANVVFGREEISVDDDDIGVLVANWSRVDQWGDTIEEKVYLSSPDHIDLRDFDVTTVYDSQRGTTEIVIIMTADSIRVSNEGEPLIEGSVKQAVLFSRHGEI